MTEMTEMHKLSGAVDEFVLAMKERLFQKETEGYFGRDGASPKEELAKEMEDDCAIIGAAGVDDRKLCVDIANRAMMIWYQARKPPISAPVGAPIFTLEQIETWLEILPLPAYAIMHLNDPQNGIKAITERREWK